MNKQPTEFEMRLAKAGYEQAVRNHPDFMPPDHIVHSWDNQSDKLKEDWVIVTRVMIEQLRLIVDDPDVWNTFAGDDLMWKQRSSQSVFLRYLDIVSPKQGGQND